MEVTGAIAMGRLISSSNCIILDKRRFLKGGVAADRVSEPNIRLANFFGFCPSTHVRLLKGARLAFVRQVATRRHLVIVEHLYDGRAPYFIVKHELPTPSRLAGTTRRTNVPVLSTRSEAAEMSDGVAGFLRNGLTRHISVRKIFISMFKVKIVVAKSDNIKGSRATLRLVRGKRQLITSSHISLCRRSRGALVNRTPNVLHRLVRVHKVKVVSIVALFKTNTIGRTGRIGLVIGLRL